MNPPLPQPAAQTCSQCGSAVDGNSGFCPHCGAALGVKRGVSVWNQLLQVVLALVGLGAGSFGACFVLLGGLGIAGNTWKDWLPVVGAGAVGIAIAAACIWGIVRINKRSR